MTIKEVSRALEKFKGYERQIGDTLVKSSLIKPVSKNISRSRNVKKKYYKGPSFNDYLID
jgi:hypothetical protein